MLELPAQEESYWREGYPAVIYPQLKDDLEVDVAIIGAGITGLTAAYLLKKSGFKVAVVEKSTVGGGTTGRTTGKVTSQHNLVYSDLQNRLGQAAARIYGEANQAAVKQIGNIIKQEKISCEWQGEDNYVYTDNPAKIDLFKQEAKTAAALGLPATFETKTPLPFDVTGAVKFTGQAKLNSQKYLLGLARAVHGNGSYVFEGSNVIGIRDGSPGHIKTKRASIDAKHIIVATNVPTLPLMARATYCLLEYPRESYIVAGLLPRELDGMYISPDKHNYSILPVGSDSQKLILIGGESHISGLRGNTESRYQRLADYAEKRFGVTAITNRWSDRDYLSYDNVPLIGKLYPWSKNLYVGTGFMKWGLSNGTVAGMILHDTIRGAENPWASTFNSSRLKPAASIPRAARLNILGKY
jgi:glycine/D-amino acid oxidase-like deaminating enzyme